MKNRRDVFVAALFRHNHMSPLLPKGRRGLYLVDHSFSLGRDTHNDREIVVE